jgi:hypothetical protein
MNLSRRMTCLGSMLLVVGCASAPSSINSSPAENTLRAQAVTVTYYVNNKSGSNCTNSSAGTSQTQPWCDFTPVNAKTFQPGEQLLLARGATWFQSLQLKGSGTASDPISLNVYGTGNRPIIRGNGTTLAYGISLISNPNHWAINNLEISQATTGIDASFSTLGNQGLSISDVFIHDVTYGMYVGGSSAAPTPSAAQWILKGVVISGVEVASADYAFILYTTTAGSDYSNYPPNSLQNITLKSSYTHNMRKVSVALSTVSDSFFFDNYFDFTGKIAEPQGTTGFYLWRCSNNTASNNVLVNMPNTNSFDQSAADHEGYTSGIRWRGNYIADNAGPGLEFLALGGRAGDYNNNHEASSNTFLRNGGAGNPQYKSSLDWINSTGINMTGVARDNLYFEPTGFASGTPSGWSLTNNRTVNAAPDLYHAGFQFGTVQGTNRWSYQATTGGAYSNLTFDNVNYRWGTANSHIRQFSILPDACNGCWIARAWTAPKAGTLSLRGRVFKNETSSGDGVLARITRNGTVIWPSTGSAQAIAFNDRSGFDTNLDNITVSVGDVLRFEVNNGGANNAGGDLTSWVPGIGYTVNAQPPGPGNLTLLDDTDASLSYLGGGWGVATGLDQTVWVNGTSHYSNTTGASVQYTCPSCQEITWDATKSPEQGIANVYVDGAFVTTVDMYAAARQGSRVRFGTGVFSTPGTHTLKVEISGSKNPSATGTYLEVDAIQAINNPTVIDDSSATYTGSWGAATGLDQNVWVNGTSHYSNATGAAAQYTCSSCREILWSATKSSDQGIANLYVDGTFFTSIDMYASARQGSRVRVGTGVFGAPGQHTLRVEVSGNKNASASNTYLEVDAFQAVN